MTGAELIAYLKTKLDILYYPLIAILQIVIILVIASVAIKLGNFIINKFFKKQMEFKYKLDEKRLATIHSMTKSIYRYAIYILAGVAILAKVTSAFNLGSVMTAAGIGGLAIGFGAQSLIKDIISGFFIIMENQFAVGDLITIENLTGTVEGMELRVTKLRSFDGDLYIIPNGEIKKITNHVRGDKTVMVDLPVAYSSDINAVLNILNKICDRVAGEFDTLVEKPQVMGITKMTEENMSVRIIAKAIANEHWPIERYIRKLAKEQFEKEGIRFADKYMIYEEKEGGGKNGG